uniref:Uncharacterized protein n=1 Tax=viral metagenome TaxID=1070528 RepID=A0A6M3IHV7_9ZZZZ
MMKGKRKIGLTLFVLALMAACFVVIAAEVVVKYSGPSGQGEVVYWAPSTGTTNLTFTVNGLSNVHFAAGGCDDITYIITTQGIFRLQFVGLTTTQQAHTAQFVGMTTTQQAHTAQFVGMTTTQQAHTAQFVGMTTTQEAHTAQFVGLTTTQEAHTAQFVGLTTTQETIVGAVFADVDVVATSVSTTQATITCTCKDLMGDTLAAAKTFQFWFTTPTIQTVPSLEGLESWTYVAHGEVESYWDLNTPGDGSQTNMIYVGTTHTDGTMDFLVTSTNVGWTNYFHVLGPNGSYSATAVKYVAP